MAFAPVFQRPFPATFDRRAAAAAAAAWYVVAGKTCVAAYQPKGAASLAASYVNLANPGTYDAAPGIAPTLTADGWTFAAASSQYLTTGITIASGWSVLLRFSNLSNRGASTFLFGSSNAGYALARCSFFVRAGDTLFENGGQLSVADTSTAAVYGVSAGSAYKDGLALTGTIPSWSGTQLAPVFIGCRSNNGSPAGYASAYIQAIAIYSATLTAGEVATLSAAMAAL